MQIYSPSNELIYTGYVGDQSYRYKSIAGDNTLTVYISTPNYIEIPIGSYVYFQRDNTTTGEYYYLLRPQNLIKNHTQNWEYVLVLEAQQYLLRTRQFKFFTESTTGAPDKPYKLKGWYTATPFEWLTMIVRNMNDGDTGWTIGSYIDAGRKLIEYSGETCLEFLQKIADEFNTEWYIIGKQISIGKIEKTPEAPIPLSYGYGNGLKSGVKRDIGDTDRKNRMLVIGGDRNIYRSKYGSDTLLLPKNYTIKYDGTYFEGEAGYNSSIAIEYKTDANGMYVERADKDPNELLSEGLYENTDIYPMREGTVSGVVAVDDSKALYDIIDEDNTIDYNDYWADQEKATIAFQKADMLTGKEFEINKYDHSLKRFELVPITDADVEMPKGVFIPYVGDKYAVFNIYVPTEYIQDAELRLLKATVKNFYEASMQKFIITCELSTVYSKANWSTIGNKLDIGYFVSFSDPQFFTDPQLIRIIGVKDYVNQPYKPQLELSNEVRVNSWSSMKADIRDSETTTDRVNQGNMAQTRRMWRDLEETQKALYDPDGDFFTQFIQPLYVQTMQLVAGTKSLQFEFLDKDNHSIKSDLPTPTYNSVDKSLLIAPRALKHLTIGIDDITPESNRVYLIWDINTQTFILDPTKPYYIYAKCDKSGTTGEYIASLVPIETEQVSGYYHFWIGLSNSEYDSSRSWRTMYGFTEILPGQITTDRIVSADGNNILDLVNNILLITNGLSGDLEQTLSYQSGQLDVTNATVKKSLKVDGSAIIAGFKFYNDRIESVKTITYGSTVYPAVRIIGDETQGFIELNSLVTRWTESGGVENVLQSIKIDSATGEVSSRTSDGNVSRFDSQGYLSNRAGTDAVSATTGVSLKSSIVGLGNGKMDKSSWGNNWGIVGVYGSAYNSSSNPAPAYGGWFDNLKVNGFVPNLIKLFTDSSSTTNLNKLTTMVVCASTDQKTIYLPSDADVGTTIWLKQWGAGSMRVYPSSGSKLFDDSTENSYRDVVHGHCALCTFIGDISFTGGSTYPVWLYSEFAI